MEWADRSVRRSYSYTETEALRDSAIDVIAKDEQELLKLIDGKSVLLSSGAKTLHTASSTIEEYKMSVLEKLLDLISDPNVIYILFLLGLFGILFELYNPGAILPGIVGVIALVFSFYSMNTLPINYAGLALIIFAIILFVLEIKIVSHGLLAIGGIVSLLLGSMMLLKSGSSLETARISRAVIIAATAVTALFFLFVIGAGVKAQRRKVVTGAEGMIGATCEVIELLAPAGTVKLQGEIWNAESLAGNIGPGERVRITAIRNMKLFVEPIHHN